MSAGFGSSGQKRTPEKVVMEPSESIYQQNRRNMVGTIPPPLLSRWAQGPPLPWETNWRTGARQLGLPWGGRTSQEAGDSPTPHGRKDGAGGAETDPANFPTPGEKDHGAQRSGPRLWKRSFCASRQDRKKTLSCRGP